MKKSKLQQITANYDKSSLDHWLQLSVQDGRVKTIRWQVVSIVPEILDRSLQFRYNANTQKETLTINPPVICLASNSLARVWHKKAFDILKGRFNVFEALYICGARSRLLYDQKFENRKLGVKSILRHQNVSNILCRHSIHTSHIARTHPDKANHE